VVKKFQYKVFNFLRSQKHGIEEKQIYLSSFYLSNFHHQFFSKGRGNQLWLKSKKRIKDISGLA
jgi:hypothetical protein